MGALPSLLNQGERVNLCTGSTFNGQTASSGIYNTICEHCTGHEGRLGRPQICSTRAQRPWTMPLVLAGGPARPLHILFRFLRPRMEIAHPTRISARAGARTGSRHLLRLSRGHTRRRPKASLLARRGAYSPARALGTPQPIAKVPVGCRSYRSCHSGWRRVRPFEYPHAVHPLSPRRDRFDAENAFTPQVTPELIKAFPPARTQQTTCEFDCIYPR